MPTEAEKLRTLNRDMFDSFQLGNYEAALQHALAALPVARSCYGDVSKEHGIVANNISMVLRRLGRFAEAEPYALQGLHVNHSALGKKHAEYAASLNNLGLLLIDLGKYEEAEGRLVEAEALRKELFGSES